MSSEIPQILITGGTGFIGRALLPELISRGYHLHVYTRQPPEVLPCHDGVNYFNDFSQLLDPLPKRVINLAGEGIADARWTTRRKQLLLDSRIALTTSLVACYRDRQQAPDHVISASAVGYYGAHEGALLSESSRVHPSFSHDLCRQWEDAAVGFEDLGARLCCLRIGVVLGLGGGILAKIQRHFSYGFGGIIGSGQQWMSWVSMHDLIRLVIFCLEHETLSGAVNATAPFPVTNAEFTRQLAARFNQPALLPMPELLIRLLFAQMGEELLLSGQRVVPEVAVAAGFEFEYPELEALLKNIFL